MGVDRRISCNSHGERAFLARPIAHARVGHGARVAVVAAALGVAACAGPASSTPSAVIVISPPSVCAGDAHRTVVELDARRSSARLTLIPEPPAPGEPPLSYEWRVEGGAVRLVEGDLRSDRVRITTDGLRPVHVWLTVVNDAGGTATSQRSISLTLPDFAECASGDECLDGERCEGARCVPEAACDEDAECPACTVCDVARSVCVLREEPS